MRTIFPSTEEIALGIAKRDKARINSTGALALKQLGLSVEIPMNLVYLTDGPVRKIKVQKKYNNIQEDNTKKLNYKK